MKKTTKDWFLYGLATIIVLAMFILVGILIFVEIKPQNEQLLVLILGQLIAAFLTVINYFYSSSKGSADKTDMLAKTQPIKEELPI
jgi:drug/metabolite transporter (DMT)-like permease